MHSRTCSFCGNKNIKAAAVQYVYRHGGKFLIMDDVPCVQCEYCGEQYFQAKDLKKIEKSFFDVHARGKRSARTISVPVLQFA